MIKYTVCILEIMMLLIAPVFMLAGDHDGSRRLKTLNPPQPAASINTTGIRAALRTLYHGGSTAQISQTSPAPDDPAKPDALLQYALPLTLPAPESNAGVHVEWNRSTGVPRRIEVTPSIAGSTQSSRAPQDPVSTAQAFLSSNRALLRIDHPELEFSLLSKSIDQQGITHVRFKQLYQGIEIWASDVYVHLDSHGSVILFNGTYLPTPQMANLVPGFSGEQALQKVRSELASLGEPDGLPIDLMPVVRNAAPSATQVIWFDDAHQPHLAWHVEIRTGFDRDWYYFIDAQNGSVLDFYNNTKYDAAAIGTGIDLNGVQRNFGTLQTDSSYLMIDTSEPMFDALHSQIPQQPLGAIVTFDLRRKDLIPRNTLYLVQSADNTWTDSSSVSAHYSATQVYRYYKETFGRNSINDSGLTIASVVHVTDGRRPMDNAFWSGEVMCYGDGRYDFKPLAGAFDVAVHEMTHGITQYTANLVYKGQSGALNESISDVFATALDSANWTLGEQIIKNTLSYPSGCLRDLSNPHNGSTRGNLGWQPATMSEYFRVSSDNGGVHINSGIPNHAFYLVATTVGRPTAAAVWYKALTQYLTSSATFVDARIATEEAARALYGSNSTELAAVSDAWDSVEVVIDTAPPPTSQLSGENWILGLNTNPEDPHSLTIARPETKTTSDDVPLTMTEVLTRPAVTDTSGLILFVGSDNRLRAIDASQPGAAESLVDSSDRWWSVAVGPGLSSVALTSKYLDTTIYYFNLATNEARQFNVSSGALNLPPTQTTLYADALSFDPSGEFILFDSYNVKLSATGDSTFFWTINLLDIRNGSIKNAFASQSSGISVSNPAFSKTSPNRFTYDYSDSNLKTRYVLAADITTGRIGVIAGPLPDFAYPTYSGDDKHIAYHTLDTIGGVPHHSIHQINTDSTLIRGAGTSSLYRTDRTYPIWFVIGRRLTGIAAGSASEPPRTPLLRQNYPNPFNPSTTIGFSVSRRGFTSLKVYNVLGEEIVTLVSAEMNPGSYEIEWNASRYASGTYFYRLAQNGFTQTRKLILLK